jgi:hypothetical protein
VLEANASRYHGKAPDELDWTDKQRQTRAVAEYLAARGIMLGGAAYAVAALGLRGSWIALRKSTLGTELSRRR